MPTKATLKLRILVTSVAVRLFALNKSAKEQNGPASTTSVVSEQAQPRILSVLHR